jgi:hypothetical protein
MYTQIPRWAEAKIVSKNKTGGINHNNNFCASSEYDLNPGHSVNIDVQLVS